MGNENKIDGVIDNVSGVITSEILEDAVAQPEVQLVHRCAISTQVDEYMVMPFDGEIKEISTVIAGAITTPDETITFNNGVAGDELGVITIAFTGSAAGVVDSLVPIRNYSFSAGDVLEMKIGGESTNSPQCDIVILYQG